MQLSIRLTDEIRTAFLKYFQQQDHVIVPSSSLVPHNDPSLLFTNAGMVQFKEIFLGKEKRSYTRAASVQKVLRAGGKHNDLENVGYTVRHHTFFEMLGNFSFGDYFKREAIHYAWEFITKILQLPPERLWVTVYHQDQEAETIWLQEIGIDPNRFSRLGDADNFWSMGDTGPCGPCSEIFFDHGEKVAGGPPGSPDADGDRYVEIWNLVFMQYDRQINGQLYPLPKPSVDTGMGLERIAAVMQGAHDNYHNDLFKQLMANIAQQCGLSKQDIQNHSHALRILADHIRAVSFLVTDDVLPSNEGRGYVLRRIIRRALRHAQHLTQEPGLFPTCVGPLVSLMADAYPILLQSQELIERIITQEENKFSITLQQGLKLLTKDLAALSEGEQLSGRQAFTLYDTYGFPIDLTADFAREHGVSVDLDGFEIAMQEQKQRSRATDQFKNMPSGLQEILTTDFTGYHQECGQSQILGLWLQQTATEQETVVTQLTSGHQGIVMLDQTPFYAEAGGQVADQGYLKSAQGALFKVFDTQREGTAYYHYGQLEAGTLAVGEPVTAAIDSQRRANICRNHSATHLLHAALRKVLGEKVVQKGSLVDDKRIRFDFTYDQPVKTAELQKIQHLVNEQIILNSTVNTTEMSPVAAKAAGAIALFGEKYEDQVRVLTMGTNQFSMELCGGTHVNMTGDIGCFCIINEYGVAAGVRRIEAVSGFNALAHWHTLEQHMKAISTLTKVDATEVTEKIQSLQQKQQQQEKQLQHLQQKLATHWAITLLDQTIPIGDVQLITAEVNPQEVGDLRTLADQIQQKLTCGVVVLAAIQEQKIRCIASVNKSTAKLLPASQIIQYVSKQLGGKGGGKPTFAMGGGHQIENLAQALKSVAQWITEKQAQTK